MLFIVLRAYSLGGGTYTGIEAVSNGVPILREPRVPNAKRTMLYMALSLAFTAVGHHHRLPARRSAAASDEGHERDPRGTRLRRLDHRRLRDRPHARRS